LLALLMSGAFAAYWFMLRPMLRQWAAFKPYYQQLDAHEAGLWLRVRMSVKGLKTVLWARFLTLAGLLLTALQAIDGVDLTSLLPEIPIYAFTLTPAMYVPLIVLPAIGYVTETLRKVSNTPVGSPLPQPAPDLPVAAVERAA
jgi:hypothetical protein